MGFFVWGFLTLLALAAGLAVVLRLGARLTLGEQVVAAILVPLTFVVFSAQALGYSSLLYGWSWGAAVGLESVLTLALTRPSREGARLFARRWGSAIRRSVSPGSLVVVIPAGLLLLYLAASVWLLPSWSWDGLWYHNPITAYARQDHSLRWHDTPIAWVNSYPKNIELLSLWNVIFAPDDRLIDGVQLPMSLMGMMALASLCRRAGAAPWLSFGLGSCWLLIPAVFLNIPSSYVDVSCASLWLAAVLFLARRDATGAHRLFGTLALGLLAGSKVIGVERVAVLAPVVAFVLWRQRRLIVDGGLMLIGVLLLGGSTYLRNLIKFGNPFWPVKVHVLGHVLPGSWDLAPMLAPPWGGPDDLHALWRSFFDRHPPYMVDVRVGGFGPLWSDVLMPVVALALVIALLRRLRSPGLLAMIVLLGAAVMTPASWWGRYTLGIPAAGLLAVAMLLSRVPFRWVSESALAGIALLAVVQAWPARVGFYAGLPLLHHAWELSPRERDALKVGWWQQEWMNRREEIVHPGEASIYDDSVELLYPLWRYDGRNRVLYRPWTGSAREWLRRLQDDDARWAAIRAESPAEDALRQAGWTYLGPCHREKCAVWAFPRARPAAR